MNKALLKLCGCIFAAVGILFVLSGAAEATLAGTDDASQVVYDAPGGWENGDDGAASGDAFLPWSLSTTNTGSPNFAGHFIGDSTELSGGGAGANINSSGESFGMFGTNAAEALASRALNGALAIGQTLSLDLAVNFRNGDKGFNLFDTSSNLVFSFNVGSDDYRVNVAETGVGSVGDAYHENTQFNLSFTQSSATGGDWSITRSGGITETPDAGTYLGVASSLQLYINGTDGGGNNANNLYTNNYAVSAIPEASAVWFGSLAVGFFGLSYIRKWQRRRDATSISAA